jgi:hypothetical protein
MHLGGSSPLSQASFAETAVRFCAPLSGRIAYPESKYPRLRRDGFLTLLNTLAVSDRMVTERLELGRNSVLGSQIQRFRSEPEALKKLGIKIVSEGRLVGEDATSGRNAWPVDHNVINPETRVNLARRAHESIRA